MKNEKSTNQENLEKIREVYPISFKRWLAREMEFAKKGAYLNQ